MAHLSGMYLSLACIGKRQDAVSFDGRTAFSLCLLVTRFHQSGANNVNFQTDYDRRVEKIGEVVDGCSLLLEYLTICTEEGIISAKKAGIWTKKVTDVKYPAMKWLTSERGRAEKLRAEAERKRLAEQAAALKAVLYPEP